MNILVACSGVYPDEIGGAHTYAYELSRHLVLLGHTVTILAANQHNCFPSTEDIGGIHFIRYPFKPSSDPVRWRYRLYKGVQKAFERLAVMQEFDVIHGHWPHSTAGVFDHPLARRALRLYTFHAPFYEEEQIEASTLHRSCSPSLRSCIKSVWVPFSLAEKKKRERKVLQQADAVITLSNFMSNRAGRLFGISPQRIAVIPGGVDTQRFTPMDRSRQREFLKIPPDRKLLLTIRRLVPRMGLVNLIEAMAILKDRIQNAVLCVGGTGILFPHLQDLINRRNLNDSVFLLGHVAADDLVRWYNAADAFIMPTEFLEGFGLATVEALACGTPVLGTPVGGTGEILGKFDSSLLLPNTAPEDIAEGIRRFLDSATKRSRMAAVEFVHRNYGWPKIAKQVENIMVEKIKERRT